jgi:hypothetical protein
MADSPADDISGSKRTPSMTGGATAGGISAEPARLV